MTEYIRYTPPNRLMRRLNWTASLGSIEARGKNKTEARDNLMIGLHIAASGSYTPTIIFLRKRTALVWRELNGWYYTVRTIGVSGLVQSNTHYIGGDQGETERHARKHLANYVVDDEIDVAKDKGGILSFSNEFFSEILITIAQVITNEGDNVRFIDDWKYQRRVQRIMDNEGISFEAARNVANGVIAIEVKP